MSVTKRKYGQIGLTSIAADLLTRSVVVMATAV